MVGRNAREIVGIFENERALQTAVDELLVGGFDRSAFSLLADPQQVEAKLGHAYRQSSELEEDADAPRTAYAGPDSRVEAQSICIGVGVYVGAMFLAAILAAAGVAVDAVVSGVAAGGLAGGLAGATFARYIGRHHARYLKAQLAKGGLLLWVRVKDEAQERLAGETLKRHEAKDVHAHDLTVPVFRLASRGMSHSLSFMNRLGL